MDLGIILGMILAVNLPYLSPGSIPTHDTMLNYHVFDFFYNHFFWKGTLPLWIPYGNFGWASDFYQLVFLSPNNYLWGLIGALFRVENALLLFKLSIVADQCLAAIGVWLLSSLLFRRRDTRLFTGLAAAGCVVWYAQVSHNFRACYLFPLAAYFLFSFFKKERLEYLALAGLAMTAQVMGGGAYYLCLWFFVFTLMAGVLVWGHGVPRMALRGAGRRDVVWTALFGLALAFVAWYAKSSLALGSMTTAGRDPATGKVLLDNFLTYGGSADLSTVLARFLSGWPTHLPYGSGRDNSVYMGLLPFLFFVWSLFRVRRVEYWAFLCGAAALVWLSLGGVFARLVYHFPLMAYYRHIGLVYAAVKIMLIFCAGFGWEDFWSRKAEISPRLRWACLAVLILDLLVYQRAVFKESFRLAAEEASLAEVFKVRPSLYQDTRLEQPLEPRQIKALKVSVLAGPTTHHVAYDFAQLDPCRSRFRADQVSPWVDLLSKAVPAGDRRLPMLTGCGYPKIRLVPKAVFAASDDEAAERLKRGDPQAATVLSGAPGPAGSARSVKASYEVLSFAPDRLTLKADVRSSPGAWLVYADAYHPGWSARVNGAARPIARADLAFKALWLERGASLVELSFRPARGVWLSSLLALFGVAVACAVPLCLLI